MSNIEIRKAIKTQRQTLALSFQEEVGNAIFNHFINLNLISDKTRIGCYYAASGEVPTIKFQHHCWQQHKDYYLPVLSNNDANSTLQFANYQQQTQTTVNQYNILEPINTEIINAKELDLVLVPLVAFDENCNRLGMGKGYYDKTFAFRKNTIKPMLIGLAYEMQKTNAIDVNKWDIPMDMIITETSIYSHK